MRFISKFSFIAAIFSVAILASVQSGSAANLMVGGLSGIESQTTNVHNTNWRRSSSYRYYRVIRRLRRIRRIRPIRPVSSPRQVPEINVYSGGAALAVLLFGMLLLRERFVRS